MSYTFVVVGEMQAIAAMAESWFRETGWCIQCKSTHSQRVTSKSWTQDKRCLHANDLSVNAWEMDAPSGKEPEPDEVPASAPRVPSSDRTWSHFTILFVRSLVHGTSQRGCISLHTPWGCFQGVLLPRNTANMWCMRCLLIMVHTFTRSLRLIPTSLKR